MQRETSKGIFKTCCHEGSKEIALAEAELKNTDHSGEIYREQNSGSQHIGKDFGYWRPTGKDES